MNDSPEPLLDYPVKMKLFRHQVRGANMAARVDPNGGNTT
mgnify:CR=1 FL=1